MIYNKRIIKNFTYSTIPIKRFMSFKFTLNGCTFNQDNISLLFNKAKFFYITKIDQINNVDINVNGSENPTPPVEELLFINKISLNRILNNACTQDMFADLFMIDSFEEQVEYFEGSIEGTGIDNNLAIKRNWRSYLRSPNHPLLYRENVCSEYLRNGDGSLSLNFNMPTCYEEFLINFQYVENFLNQEFLVNVSDILNLSKFHFNILDCLEQDIQVLLNYKNLGLISNNVIKNFVINYNTSLICVKKNFLINSLFQVDMVLCGDTFNTITTEIIKILN